MQMKFTLTVAAALAGCALAAPQALTSERHAATVMAKRFVGGQCGIHVDQQLGVNSWYNQFTVTVKDGNGNPIGDDCSAYSINTSVPDEGIEPTEGQLTCQRADQPWPLSCTIQPDAETWSCTYESGSAPYTFGTANGCSVGKWDGPHRQADCGFSC